MKNIVLPIRFGIAISGSLIAYFLILSLFNLHTTPAFSLLNSVIVAFGIYEAIKSYKLREGIKFNYTNGFITGIISGFVATFIFTIFFAFYAIEFETDFLIKLIEPFRGHEIIIDGPNTNNIKIDDTLIIIPAFERGMDIIVRVVIVSTVAIMGFISTLILTLVFMQLFTRSQNIPQSE